MVNDDMLQGYMDGSEQDAIPPFGNRSASYVHGWLNGHDDRNGTPRDTASNLRRKAREAEVLDRLAGIISEGV